MFYQQGDVLIKKETKIPSNFKKVKKENKITLAEGEVTGHSHSFYAVCDVDLFLNENGGKYIDVKKDSVLSHEEHNTISITAGIYKIGIVQEYDHFAEEARNVAD